VGKCRNFNVKADCIHNKNFTSKVKGSHMVTLSIRNEANKEGIRYKVCLSRTLFNGLYFSYLRCHYQMAAINNTVTIWTFS